MMASWSNRGMMATQKALEKQETFDEEEIGVGSWKNKNQGGE